MTRLRFFDPTFLKPVIPVKSRGGYFGWTDRFGMAAHKYEAVREIRRPYFIANY